MPAWPDVGISIRLPLYCLIRRQKPVQNGLSSLDRVFSGETSQAAGFHLDPTFPLFAEKN